MKIKYSELQLGSAVLADTFDRLNSSKKQAVFQTYPRQLLPEVLTQPEVLDDHIEETVVLAHIVLQPRRDSQRASTGNCFY